MKLSIAIFVIFASLASTNSFNAEDARLNSERYIKECGEELKLTASELKNYLTPDVPDGPIGQCFVKCMVEKAGFFDKDNRLKIEGLINIMSIKHHFLGDSEYISMIKNCVKDANKIENICERAHRAVLCAYQVKK